jgi:hypothetical protein
VNMHAEEIVDATIKAVIPQTDGIRLQVEFGFNIRLPDFLFRRFQNSKRNANCMVRGLVKDQSGCRSCRRCRE